jgi:hypothetical protein
MLPSSPDGDELRYVKKTKSLERKSTPAPTFPHKISSKLPASRKISFAATKMIVPQDQLPVSQMMGKIEWPTF